MHSITRRTFLQRTARLSAALALTQRDILSATADPNAPLLDVFSYSDVTLDSELHQRQLENTHSILMGLDADALMKPFRAMSTLPAPGPDLGGWYMYKPDYDYRKDSAGLCPGGTFGQWISALARMYAITGDAETREKVLRLNRLYAQTISAGFYEKTRFPAYS